MAGDGGRTRSGALRESEGSPGRQRRSVTRRAPRSFLAPSFLRRGDAVGRVGARPGTAPVSGCLREAAQSRRPSLPERARSGQPAGAAARFSLAATPTGTPKLFQSRKPPALRRIRRAEMYALRAAHGFVFDRVCAVPSRSTSHSRCCRRPSLGQTLPGRSDSSSRAPWRALECLAECTAGSKPRLRLLNR